MLSLFSFQFNEPDKDELLIRQHSYVKGCADTLLSILQLDERAAEEYKKRLEAATEAALNPGVPLQEQPGAQF